MAEFPELVCAYVLDGSGGGVPLDWPGVNAWTPDQGSIWVHLDCTHANTDAWLRDHSGLDTFVVDGLMAEESRPRCDDYDDGTLLVLRGVNLNPGAEPEDMVSIRLWIDSHRVISTRFRRLMAVEDIRQQLASGKGPVSAGHLVARLAARLTERMSPVIENLSDQLMGLEHTLIGVDGDVPGGARGGEAPNMRAVRSELIDCRRVAIALRRYINPQRDALSRLAQFEEIWLDARTKGRLRETVDRVTRFLEELDEIRERAVVVQDELVNRISQRMEKTMYVLTVVATVMLPLGFLTGLLGINVGGIPGSDASWAFWAVCGALVGLVVLEIWMMRHFKWI